MRVRPVLVIAAAVPLVLLGTILLFMPGPGLVLLFLALVLLGLEFRWARKLDKDLRSLLKYQVKAVRKRLRRKK